MAKQAVVAGTEKPSVVGRVQSFVLEVRDEMRKVNWPPMEELKQSTSVVMLVLLLVGAIIFAYDGVFKFVVVGLLNLLG